VGEAVKKEDEETLTPVGPGAEGLKDADAASEKDEPEDRRLAHDEGEELDDEEKPQAGARKKETAKERRERAKKSRERERLEYNFLLKRNEDLEKRFAALEGRTAQSENAAVDQRINTIQTQLSNADRVLAEALRKPNGAGAEEFVEAQRIRDELRDQLHELKRTAQQRQQAQKQQARPEPAQPQPDPRVLRRARDWASQHDWFSFDGQDEESVVVRAIDESLAAEGFDPTSSDYWDELTERVRHRLPERFKGARARADEGDDESDDEKSRPKAGPKFSSGGRERPLKKGEVYVSAERKAAMQQYGVWEDPVARNRMLKKYAQWDAEMSASNRS
jgi:hypothetical protein